jgi:regulator of replication initiation timing
MPRTASQKTKEELLVENAILRNNDHLRAVLKEELAPFTKVIKDLDQRLGVVEKEVDEIKDTVAPFSAIKKRIWFAVIFASLLVGLAGSKVSELLGGK